MHGSLLVCGTTSDAGKSWVVTGLCRLLARRGVRVAPFKGQNMALNAAVTADGGEIGHAQWVQALAAGVEPEVAMNPVLLKPTGDRTSQVIVLGRSDRSAGAERDAAGFHADQPGLRPVVLDALASLRARFDVVIGEGAGGAAEINLLDGDLANLPLADAAGLPAIVVADIERGGAFAALYGTVALLPPELARWVRGFVLNRFRGDPALLGDGPLDLERRCGVPTLGVIPRVDGLDLDAEDSLALERWSTTGGVFDVAAIRFPRVANFGDLDPLRLEPGVSVRWVRSATELGRPHLVVLPGSKATRADLAWLRDRGLDAAIGASGAAVLAICAGAQMLGRTIEDPHGVEGAPGSVDGLGWLPLRTTFAPDKVLDRPDALVVSGPGAGRTASGYRIHHGRMTGPGAEPWLVAGGDVIGWRSASACATSLHGLLEDDHLRAAVITWAAGHAGVDPPPASGLSFAAARTARFDAIADTLESSLDLDRLLDIVAGGAPAGAGT